MTKAPASSTKTQTSKHTRGTLKFFDFGRLFGFITPEDPDLSEIHITGVVFSRAGFVRCKNGTPLEVWYVEGAKGLTAVRVAPLGETDD